MKKFLITGLLAAAVLLPSLAHAIDFTATGTILTVSYTEPTMNANTPATPLDDLAFTNVYYQLDSGAEVKTANVPASKPQGGGGIVTNITVPIGPNQRAVVTVRATATDTSGNESAKSVAVSKTVDRLPPLPPQ